MLAATAAIVRIAMAALIVISMIALLLSFMTRPRETFTGLLAVALCTLASAQPIACIVTLGGLVLVAMAMRKPREQLLLTDDRQAD